MRSWLIRLKEGMRRARKSSGSRTGRRAPRWRDAAPQDGRAEGAKKISRVGELSDL